MKRPPRWLRRMLFGCLLAIAVVAALAAPMGCTTTVVPPMMLNEPVTVYLLDHGRTPSLVLPTADGGLVRFVYGDWNYYALGNRGIFDGASALLWPTPGTLGRQVMDGPQTTESVRGQLTIETEQLNAFQVERQQALRLAQRLNKMLDQQSATLVFNAPNRAEFGRSSERYTYFHNSNHVAATWLRELGCQVNGPAFNSRWKVLQAPSDGGT